MMKKSYYIKKNPKSHNLKGWSEKWGKVHQVREKKIKQRVTRLVDDVEIIHTIVERDFAQVVVLERLLN